MKVEDLKKLHQKKYREQHGLFLVEGEHLVQELEQAAQADRRLLQSQLFVTPEHEARKSRFKTTVVGARQMSQISETHSPQGIVGLVPVLPPLEALPGERAIYLYEVQDPGNLGTTLRSLAWFGKFRCLLSPGCVDAHNGKAVRASMGAVFQVPIETEIPLASLPERYKRIACLDLAGRSIASPEFQNFDCYVFGNEARGLTQAAMASIGAQAFTITGAGALESLNVATTVSICQYELHRKS